jgi:(2Fe-2S) ferredoxin
MSTSTPEENQKPRHHGCKRTHTIFCCHGSDCIKNGAKETCKELRTQIREAGLKHEVHIVKTDCTDECKQGPIVIVGAEEGSTPCGLVWYRKVHPKDAASIANDHLLHGQPVDEKRLNPDESA